MIFALALVVLGALVGLLTVALSVAVDGGASLFAERPQLVWLLPVAGLCSYGAYRAVGLDFSWSTARVMEAVRDGRSVPPLLAPAIIVGTALTVLCGGSVGKEAAALQMGAAASGLLRDRVSARFRTVLAPAAMGAALGAMLDAPLAGVVFSFEALRRRPDSLAALVAPAVTSFASWGVSQAMGVRFLPDSLSVPDPWGAFFSGNSLAVGQTAGALLLFVAVGAAAGLAALAFCRALEKLRGGLARLGAPVFALAVGGVATALVVGYADLFHYEDVRSYCGMGLLQIEAALAGEALPWWAFIVKAALTLLTLAGGFKGGEIMPVLAVGACLGAAVFSAASLLLPASILGVVGASRSLGALVGMVAFFSACTNCPLTALVFAGELFGFASLPATIVAMVPAYLVARRVSLYPTSLERMRGRCHFDPVMARHRRPFRGRTGICAGERGCGQKLGPRRVREGGVGRYEKTSAPPSENARLELWAVGFQGAGVFESAS